MKSKLNKLSKLVQINNIVKILVILISMSILFSIINYTNSMEKDSVEMFIESLTDDSGRILSSAERRDYVQEVNDVLGEADTLTANIKLGDERSQDKKDTEKSNYEAKIKQEEADAEAKRRSAMSVESKKSEDIIALKKQIEEQEHQLEEQQMIDEQRKSDDEQRKSDEHRSSLSERDRAIKNYTEYNGIIEMGNYSKDVGKTDFSNSESIEGAVNGCMTNISLEDAQKTCDNATDCNSFYSFNPKGEGRVCFKNNSSSNNIHKPASDPNSSFFIKNYKKYPNVLHMGEYPNEFSNSESIEGAVNGCMTNISFEDAKTTCDNATDCNSFYSYNGDDVGKGRVCFKNNSKPTNTNNPVPGPNDTGKSAFFVKN